MSATESIFKKLKLPRQPFKNNSYTQFYKNPTYCLVAAARSQQTDRRKDGVDLNIIRFFCFIKKPNNRKQCSWFTVPLFRTALKQIGVLKLFSFPVSKIT